MLSLKTVERAIWKYEAREIFINKTEELSKSRLIQRIKNKYNRTDSYAEEVFNYLKGQKILKAVHVCSHEFNYKLNEKYLPMLGLTEKERLLKAIDEIKLPCQTYQSK